MSEFQEQKDLFYLLSLVEDRVPEAKWIFSVPASTYTTSWKQKTRQKQAGYKKGVWDIFCLFPRSNFNGIKKYNGLIIEMKFDKNTLTAEQMEFKRVMEFSGHLCQVYYDSESAFEGIINYLTGKSAKDYGIILKKKLDMPYLPTYPIKNEIIEIG